MFISKPYSREIDSTDIEIMSLITKGYSSSYTIWSAMKKEAKERPNGKKVMAYININKRVTELARMGLLEELKPDELAVNIHGRKDYTVTMKGMEQLVPYFLEHPEAIRDLTDYLNKVGLDKYQFAILLKEKYASATEALNVYQWCTNALYYPFRTHPENLIDWINKHQDINKIEKEIHNRMIKAQNRMNADMIDVTHDINNLVDYFKSIEDKDKEQMINIENKERVLPDVEIIPTTTDSSEVVKEIRQITNKYYKLQSNSERKGPNDQNLLHELDQAINKYRPEIAREDIITGFREQNAEIEEYIDELLSKEYVHYDPNTELYSVTKKGKKNIESNRLQLLELYFANTQNKEIVEHLKLETSRSTEDNKIDEILKFSEGVKTSHGRKKKPASPS